MPTRPQAALALACVLLFGSCEPDGWNPDAAAAPDIWSTTDAGAVDAPSSVDARAAADGATADVQAADRSAGDVGLHPDFFATGAGEHDLGGGWIGAAQPSQARLTEVVGMGARVISLRYVSEESFDEAALIASLGGSFVRYPTSTGELYDSAFREGLYDLYDAQRAQGGNVYLHCASSNRVGATWALYHAERLGYPPEEAIQVGRAAGLSGLESVVREILGIS